MLEASATFSMNTPHCIIHCRVSTGKQAYEGESLETQSKVCLDLAARNGWSVAHEPWLEAYSGRKSSRPAFNEILAFIDVNPGLVTHYIFRAIDRFTRGGVLFYARMKQELADRGVALVDTFGIIQPMRNTLEHTGFEYDWSKVSPSEISEVVMAATAKVEVNTILTRLIGQEIYLTRSGYKIRAPQDGFKNERVVVDGRRRSILVADPERGHFLRAMFELRASGKLSDAAIVEKLNAMGYRRRFFQLWNGERTAVIGVGGGGKLTPKKYQEIIKRPIYCGVIWEKWTNWKPVKAKFDGLVSMELWNAANRGVRYLREQDGQLELLFDFDPERAKVLPTRNNPAYPFKNVVLCPTCRKPFMGSASRGRSGRRFPAYHCDRNHARVARSKEAFEHTIAEYVQRLRFAPDIVPAAMSALLNRFDDRAQELAEEARLQDAAAKRLRQEQDEAVAAFKKATSDITRRALERDIERLQDEIDASATKGLEPDVTEENFRAYAAGAAEFLENPAIILETSVSPAALHRRYSQIFEALPTLSELEAGTAKLSPIYWLFEGQDDLESVLVRLRGLTWNQINHEIRRNNNDC